MARSAGGHFICVEMELIAQDISSRLMNDTKIVGVGRSGTRLARRIDPEAPAVASDDALFNKVREYRYLDIGPVPEGLPDAVTIVDDLVVSGVTLREVDEAMAKESIDTAAEVGFLYKSKRTRRRAGMSIGYSFRYSMEGGGSPPINSVATLLQYPERMQDLAERYFPTQGGLLSELLREAL